MPDVHRSEVAAFRERQALEEEAARLALFGLASVASHQMITARMQRGAERILALIDEGKHEEAQALMNTEYWQAEVEPGSKGRARKKNRLNGGKKQQEG
jgi:hypothetical protein